jgi:membrane protein involved in colicin uptake
MENQLEVIVRNSGLEVSKAKYILEQFQDFFALADDWSIKSKTLVVTRPDQTAEMAMAREGRLFLREKRIAVENARKGLKEQALREGKAIDGIANVLKALIVPIEEYLDKQEHFVEIQEEAKREQIRLEIEKRIEDERIAKEKADAEALEKARIENEKLKAEAIEREKKAKAEREAQEKKLKAEREKAAAKQREQDEILAKERAKARAEQDKAEAEKRATAEAARKEKAAQEAKVAAEKAKLEEKARKEKEAAQKKLDAERKEKERLAELLKNQIECPNCHHKFQLNKEAK